MRGTGRAVPRMSGSLLMAGETVAVLMSCDGQQLSISILSFCHTPLAVDTAVNFCRAMLCKRGLCRHADAVSVRLSVHLSATFVNSVKSNKHNL